jgi:medium-chain acyl-[acyl-carrier-protein] hydrolase
MAVKVKQRRDAWIRELDAAEKADCRLFCFPYAGGGASGYRGWPSSLPATIAVCPVQMPGRERRVEEPAVTEIDVVVRNITQSLARYFDRPFAFVGHCLGALICFEVARNLRREKMPEPVHMFLSAHRPPHLELNRRYLHRLPENEFLDEVRRFNGVPDGIMNDSELLAMVLPALRADFALYENYYYSWEEPLNIPTTVFGGELDLVVTSDDLKAWQELTQGPFSLRMLPGDHFFLYGESQPLVLESIQKQLAGAKRELQLSTS